MKQKLQYIILLAFIVTTSSVGQESEKQFIKENMNFAKTQVENMMRTSFSETSMPHSMNKEGEVARMRLQGWTSGFFPGTLWYLSEYTGDKVLTDSARVFTERMEPIKRFTDNHDIGFMMYCPYGNAYRLNPSKADEDILIESARSLSTRYNTTTGTIKSWNSWRSWNSSDRVYEYPVIIDNMMNLELLFFASEKSGDDSFKNIAISHAEKTMKN